MTKDVWTAWPSWEALARESRKPVQSRARTVSTRGVRLFLGLLLLWGSIHEHPEAGVLAILGGLLAALVGVLAVRGFFRTTRRRELLGATGALFTLLACGYLSLLLSWSTLAFVMWCGIAVIGLERLPLIWGVPFAVGGLGSYALFVGGNWLATSATCAGLALAGYVLRLDAEARGGAQRLLVQERAASAARTESAALTERARIAREIHDVLAHSLSAQLVHLEAARLQIEQGADRATILERVVAARGMAKEGLAETRQALSALRGEMAPVAEVLRDLVHAEGARFEIHGDPRPLPAEAGQTVRRVAQEALTNVRKHAPGAEVTVRLSYQSGVCELEVRNGPARGARPELAESGAGYGLQGMRERAELLGGALTAGPPGEDEKGFVVRLRVPA
ncbi:sensor histidine kinase [Streptomyces sp. NPDC007088]|uniref:sensor histidine kinase n=1 Tax=Streptomyces sp. NPDC007088 TaxID=3364773 RepID=UPI0036C57834